MLPIKNWSEDDRPREKLLKHGVAALSNAELIAILIGSGNKDLSAVDLSKLILHHAHDNLNQLARLTLDDLMAYKGIGEAKAISIVAALELGKRRKLAQALDRKQIRHSQDLFHLFNPILADLPYEEFWIALLNNANKIIQTKKLFQGGTTQSTVDIPLILKTALLHSATSIAISHNHPSGNLTPSQADKIITQKLHKACQTIGIQLIDHIIIANQNYFSFADQQLIR